MKSVVTDDMKLLLKGRDAATVCGCTTRMWRIWDRLGYTPMPVRIGKSLYWRYPELLQWIEAGCPRREEWVTLSTLKRETASPKTGGRLPEARKIKNT